MEIKQEFTQGIKESENDNSKEENIKYVDMSIKDLDKEIKEEDLKGLKSQGSKKY